MLDWINVFLTNHTDLIGLVVFIIMFLDCLALLGLAIPGNTLFVVTSIMAGGFNYPLWKVVFLGFLGALLGDIISYAIGYKLKRRIYTWNVVKNNTKWFDKADNYFQRYGALGLLFGRFVSPLRATLPLMTGVFHFSFFKFLLINCCSILIWCLCFAIPSWFTGAAISLSAGQQFWVGGMIVAVALILLVGVGFYGCAKERRWVALCMSLISAILFILLYLFLPYLDAFDQEFLDIATLIHTNTLDSIAHFVTELGGYKVQFIISAVLCFLLLLMKQIRPLVFFAFTMLGTAAIGWIIKEMVNRFRPLSNSDVMSTFSFPSGHASASFAFFISLGVLAGLGRAPKIRLFWLFIATVPAFLISISRIYLQVHWITDVLAGGLLAMAVSMGILAWVESRERMSPLPSRCWKILIPTIFIVLVGSTLVLTLKG